jgi:hypothetical protein
MITTLALRHLVVRKLRSMFLLLGFSLGVGVMIVLLSVGEAMLDQSRDISLVGGGALTVLPQGIDVEAMRTGGVSGMFFGIERARFLARQVFGGPRHESLVEAVSPVIEGKLLYLRHGGRTVVVRSGGEVPSRARAVGTGLTVRSGTWSDSRADSAYVVPTAQQFYDELDHFHHPSTRDSTWGEWHYFNVVTSPDEWWYITYVVGGEVPSGKWGGQVLITHRAATGRYERFTASVPSSEVQLDTARADLKLSRSQVRQRNGTYHLQAYANGTTGPLQIDMTVVPDPHRYFPPVETREESFLSGYVVPALRAEASGRICVSDECRTFMAAPAYHDHNWGVWRAVTWEWGTATGRHYNLLYGGVYGSTSRTPFFLALVDSLGVKQVLRFTDIRYEGGRPLAGAASATAPGRFTLVATHEEDSVGLSVGVVDALGTNMAAGDFRRVFLQMRGSFVLSGRVGGQTVADSGMGFFETYLTDSSATADANRHVARPAYNPSLTFTPAER